MIALGPPGGHAHYLLGSALAPSSGGPHELPELDPSPELRQGLAAARALQAALESGELSGRTHQALARWVESDPTGARSTTAARAIGFLGGNPLESAKTRFETAYARELASPRAGGALAWLRALADSADTFLIAEALPGLQWGVVERLVRELQSEL